MEYSRLPHDFFLRDVLEVAPALIGKTLVRRYDDGTDGRYTITETEAYRGAGDRACHASRGMTPRNAVMFGEGGFVYVYFIYGMYWMLNFVTGGEGDASAVLIRGMEEVSGAGRKNGVACVLTENAGKVTGPGRVGKILALDRSFYGESLATSQRLWIEESDQKTAYTTHPRVGIHYAGEPWVSMPWRYILI